MRIVGEQFVLGLGPIAMPSSQPNFTNRIGSRSALHLPLAQSFSDNHGAG
jgi:hypothetical protein